MHSIVKIPQTDPHANYISHQEEITAAVQRVLQSGCYISGEEVTGFESEFANYVGASHSVGVACGTDALKLALQACNVGAGDLVFTVTHTAVATVAAIETCGATPVLVDIEADSYTMNVDCLRTALRDHPAGIPRAVVPVHLYGHPANMMDIQQVAKENGLYIIEDCSQAHGAVLDGQCVGTWGHMSAFSFYPTKNLGALGDGGAVVTNEAELDERVRLLSQYGWRERHLSEIAGGNSRLDPLQAAILRAKLPHLDSENAQRGLLALRYCELLDTGRIVLPTSGPDVQHVYHQFVIRTPHRDGLSTYLRDRGVDTAIHYPVPIHLQPAYSGRLPTAGPLTESESTANEILSLPIYPELSHEDVARVARYIHEWLDVNQ